MTEYLKNLIVELGGFFELLQVIRGVEVARPRSGYRVLKVCFEKFNRVFLNFK